MTEYWRWGTPPTEAAIAELRRRLRRVVPPGPTDEVRCVHLTADRRIAWASHIDVAPASAVIGSRMMAWQSDPAAFLAAVDVADRGGIGHWRAVWGCGVWVCEIVRMGPGYRVIAWSVSYRGIGR